MDREKLKQTFRDLAGEIAERDFSHVDEATAISDLGIDSLGLLELVGSLERELSVRVPDEDLGDVRSVSQLLDVFLAKDQTQE